MKSPRHLAWKNPWDANMADDYKFSKEKRVHGKRWNTLHDGYFSDLEVALPFLDTISREIQNCHPDVIADLGGGTGFILAELAKRHPEASIRFINVDISSAQLSECNHPDISSLPSSAENIQRGSLVKGNNSLMVILRSLLHYLGVEGLTPFLKHLRAQLKSGETMVQQTACFDSIEEADCANHLYALMRTTKWYPTISDLKQTLIETGWQVMDCTNAPDLRLKSPELAERYGLTKEDLDLICREMSQKYFSSTVFTTTGSEFTAFLHYRIFVCRAR